MRKLKLGMQMTIDGFVSGMDGQQDWVMIPGPDEAFLQYLINQANSCDTLLLGRKMAQEFIDYWENVSDNQAGSPVHPLAQRIVNMRKIVFSHTKTGIGGKNVEVENGDLAVAVNALKKQPEKDILVYGGADFVSSLISLNLIDEYFMVTVPVAIGEGLTIFKERKILKLESSTPYKNGKIVNKYLPVQAGPK